VLHLALDVTDRPQEILNIAGVGETYLSDRRQGGSGHRANDIEIPHCAGGAPNRPA
jgi:hypothetical protein